MASQIPLLWQRKVAFDRCLPRGLDLEAREKAIDARKLLAQGVDPSQHKKAGKLAAAIASANTFLAISEEYIAKLRADGLTEITLEKKRWLLLDLASPLANRPA